MKKFLFDLTEVGKDVWSGIVWVVQAADELGERLGEIASSRKRTAKLTLAMPSVKRNCVAEK